MYLPRTSIKVVNFHMQETGTYNPMFERPMTTRVTGPDLDDLIRKIDQNHVRRVTAGTIAGAAYGIVAPQAAPGNQIMIPNGWDSRRIRFVLHVIVEHSTVGLTDEEYYFQGFTDHAGVSMNGAIDPNMLLVINSFVKIAQMISYDTNGGTHYVRRVAESGQVINGDIIYHNTGVNNYGLRPGDMFIGIQSAHLYNSQQDKAAMFDSRFQLNNKALKANKYHVTPASYLASLTDSYCMAKISADLQHTGNDIYESSKNIVYKDNLFQNSFFKTMMGIRGIGNGTVFTVSDLEFLDPNISSVTNCLTIGHANRVNFHSIGESEYWDSANLETQYATVLGNAVPALLMELLLSKITFMATNYVTHGEGHVTLIDGITMTGAEMTQYFEIFKMRFIQEVMTDITYNNQFKYNLTMQVDIFGDTTIDLQINGGAMTRFTVPSFLDSIATPMMTHSRDQFFNSVNDIETVITQVSDAIGSDYATVNPRHSI